MKQHSLKNFALCALLAAVSATCAAGDDWSHSKKLSFDTTAEGADVKQSVGPLPILVRLHSGNFTFTEAKPDGGDIRFFAADGKTPLKYHIESFDVANELGVVWVQMPKLSGAAKTDAIVMKWGNEKASAADSAAATYDASQTFVYHFANGQAADASSHGLNPSEMSGKPVPAGAIGGAMGFDGSGKMAIAANPALAVTSSGGFTLSTWVKVAGDGAIYTQTDGAHTIRLEVAGGTPVLHVDGVELKGNAALKQGEWQHLAATGAGGKLNLYVDGNPAGTANGNVPDLAGSAVIGEGFRGELDEIDLSSVARSADYIRARVMAEEADSPILAIVEENGEESVSYLSILLGAVTLDGWVVIGILMVMAVISFAVMIGKARFLNRAQKANEVFLQMFREQSDEMLSAGSGIPSRLSNTREVQDSSAYRLYDIGVKEMQQRFDAMHQRKQEPVLSNASLNAIRASMDAGMVRETHRLNSQIVLLTIAISGGPFLGLLGTVVGVMITFAAIAAAGDVNVNSIAPGIAAALVATVAGLGVAIPALFGYNWLAAQIKNVSSDLQVFADEFLTRAAELHTR